MAFASSSQTGLQSLWARIYSKNALKHALEAASVHRPVKVQDVKKLALAQYYT